MGQDQVAPGILSVLVGVIIGELQHGATYAAVQAGVSWVVAGVKVIWLHVPHVTGWVDKAVWQICGNGHGTPVVADKEAKGAPLARSLPALNASCTTWSSPSMSLMKSRIWSGVYRWDSTLRTMSPTQTSVIFSCWPSAWKTRRMAVVPLSSGVPSNGEGHECSLSNEFPQMVKRDALHVECSPYGTKTNVPHIESVLTLESLLWDGTWVLQHHKNPVEVKRCHLKWERAKRLSQE